MTEINIAYFNGSKRKNGSTNKVILSFINQLKENVNLNINTYDLSDKTENIEMCNGCLNCFKNGKCSINDSMDKLRTQILISDLIVFATPVYMGTVSGTMKNFLDRLSNWTHIQPLLGKRCIIIVTTQNSGVDETISYLYKVVSYFGLDVVGLIGIRKNDIDIKITEQLEIIIDRYQRIIYYKEKTFANTLRNGIFENLKNLYSTQAQAGIDTFEVNYWSEKGYFDKTLEDVLD